MENIILVVHILAAVAVIGLVLLQHGKGADMGAAFGSGASGSLFGVSGSSNLLSRLTAVFVAVFFTTSITLAYLSSHHAGATSVVKAAVENKEKSLEVKGDVPSPAQDLATSKDAAQPDANSGAKDVPH